MNCSEDVRPLSRVIDVVFRTEMALYKQNGWYYVLLAGAYKGVDYNDPSKPSHRLTNGPEPSKTIESDGSNIKKPS